MTANSEKEHLSIVICGHVDSGKSTTTGRLIFELGGLPERELEKLKQEAERLGKGSFAFAFYMDRQKEERERGVTIACTTKEFSWGCGGKCNTILYFRIAIQSTSLLVHSC